MKSEVYITPFAEKRLDTLPRHIINAFNHWVKEVRTLGIYIETKSNEFIILTVIEVTKHEY